MNFKTLCVAVAYMAMLAAPSYAAMGPVYPAPGGNDWSGSGSAPNGGAVWQYSNFDTSSFSALYFGLNQLDYGPAGAGLSGTADPFSFSSAAGTVATWLGTTTWYNHTDGVTSNNVNTRLTIDITGLGANPWITDLASIGLNTGFGDLGAVVDNSAGLDFTMNWAIESDADGGAWKALNAVRQHSSRDGQTRSSVATGFYYEEASAVPEINGAQLGIALTLLLSLVLLYREHEGFQA